MANKPLLDKDLKKILNSDAFTIKLEDKTLNFNREVQLYNIDYPDDFPLGAYFTYQYDSLISNCVYDDKLDLELDGYKLLK